MSKADIDAAPTLPTVQYNEHSVRAKRMQLARESASSFKVLKKRMAVSELLSAST